MAHEDSHTDHIDFVPGEITKGVRFRKFRSDDDFPAMSEVCIKSWMADRIEFMKTGEDFKNGFESNPLRDPAHNLLLVEADCRLVAFAEFYLIEKSETELQGFHYSHVLPEYRGDGLREALLRFSEASLEKMIRDRPETLKSSLQSWASSDPNEWQTMLLSRNYEPLWNLFEMVRPSLDDIPDAPLPEGVSVRPITEKDYRKVWEATRDEFIHQPWSTDELWNEDHYRQWLESPLFMPDLWQIAWDGDDVVGSVQNFIDNEENRAFGRKRGHTERIFVAPSWRGRGLAKALIARSLRVLKGKGMVDAGLDTEESNVHQAYKLYEKMGYRTIKQFTFYQKSL